MSLIVHAPNVHRGGGRALLLSVLDAAKKQPSSKALLDQRLEIPAELTQKLSITRVVPTITGRLAGEWALRRVVGDTDRILCFGNLPPLFRIKGRCIVFLQNRYLVEPSGIEGFPLRVQLRLMIERLWLRVFHTHANMFIVQTQSMQQLAVSALGQAVEIMAIFPEVWGYQRRRPQREVDRTTMYDFLYLATGEPHKNHSNLIEAWKILAADSLYPSLCLTIAESDSPEIFQLIEEVKRDYKLNLFNVTVSTPTEVRDLYSQVRAMIYPSFMESFGMPLVEARQAGLPILASELDYVRDIVDPEEAFDPRSPQSIARAVKRFLQVPEAPLPILSCDAFVDRLVAGQ